MRIKRSSSFVKGSAFQHANLATAIGQSEVQVGSCGHPLTGRPLWMVGKYDICFECYEKRQQKIESSLPVEASVNVKQFRGLVHQRNELLKALMELCKTVPCENCNETGNEIGTEDACRICGGYGFNPDGDIREAIVQARAVIAKALSD